LTSSCQLLSKIKSFQADFPEFGKEKLYEDRRGFIWLASSNGFHRWDGKVWNKIKLFDNQSKQESLVMSVAQDRDGMYYFSCAENGLAIYNPITDAIKFITDISIKSESQSIFVHDIVDSYSYKMLVASVQGFIVIDSKGSIVSVDRPGEKYADKNVSGHNPNGIRKGYLDSKSGYYYFGGNAGLFARHQNQDSLLHYPMTFYNAALPDGEGNHQIQDIYDDGNLLICTTWGAGIALFNKSTKTWKDYRFEKEAGNSVTISAVKIREGQYLTTQIYQQEGRSGINLFDFDKPFLVPLYDENNNPYVYANAIEKDINNQIWIGEKNTVSSYQLVDLPIINNPKGIYVYDIETRNQKFNSTIGVWDNRLISLRPSTREVTFSFRAINSTNYQEINYEYSIQSDNQEANWVVNNRNEQVTVSIADERRSTFQVRCVSPHTGDYIYSEPITLVKERFNLNTFQTWLKILLAFLLIAILLVVVVQILNRRNLKNREKEWKTSIQKLQILALRSQMNPHFLFNCLNSIRYFIIKNDNKNAAMYLTKFSRLLRSILENTEKEKVSVKDEIEMLELYLEMEKLRFNEKFDYTIELKNLHSPSTTFIPSMIVQPFVENALIHGLKNIDHNGKISITFIKLKSELEINVVDNGVGRQRAKQLQT